MDWVSDTVFAFGETLGLPALALDEDGYLVFALEPSGTLCVQDLQGSGSNEVLVMLAQPLPQVPAIATRQALQLTDFRGNPTWPIQLGVRNDNLVVTLRMPRHSFIVSALEEAVDALFDFHARVARAG